MFIFCQSDTLGGILLVIEQFSLDNATAEICCYDECLNCPHGWTAVTRRYSQRLAKSWILYIFFVLKWGRSLSQEISPAGNLLWFTNPMFSWRFGTILGNFQSTFLAPLVGCQAWSLLPSPFICCYRARVFNSLSLSETYTHRIENITKKSSTQLEEVGQEMFQISTLLWQFFYKYAPHKHVYMTFLYEVSRLYQLMIS